MDLFVEQKNIMLKNISDEESLIGGFVIETELESKKTARQMLREPELVSGNQKEDVLPVLDSLRSMRSKGSSTTPTVQSDSPKLPSTGDVKILQGDCIPQSTTLSQGVLDSMSLIDDSAKHLHGLMKGLMRNEPEPDVKLYETQKVETAIACAHQIANLLRLKKEYVTEVRAWNQEPK